MFGDDVLSFTMSVFWTYAYIIALHVREKNCHEIMHKVNVITMSLDGNSGLKTYHMKELLDSPIL